MQLTIHGKILFDKNVGDLVMINNSKFRINASLVKKYRLHDKLKMVVHEDEEKQSPNHIVLEFTSQETTSEAITLRLNEDGALFSHSVTFLIKKVGLPKGYYTMHEVEQGLKKYYPLTFSDALTKQNASTRKGGAIDYSLPLLSIADHEIIITDAVADRFQLGQLRTTYAFAQDSLNPDNWYIHFSSEVNQFYHAIHFKQGRCMIRRGHLKNKRRAVFPPFGRYKLSDSPTLDDDQQREFYQLIPINN